MFCVSEGREIRGVGISYVLDLQNWPADAPERVKLLERLQVKAHLFAPQKLIFHSAARDSFSGFRARAAFDYSA